MLFTYSPFSLSENWLNLTIIQILNDGIQAILQGQAIPAWPNVIPVARREELRGRSGVRKRLRKFWDEFATLERPSQEALLVALGQQTSLPNILFDDVICTGIDGFSEGIKDATVELFRFLFDEQLTTLMVNGKCLRDVHYSAIYADFPSRICPFCGLGYFRAPGAPRNALDHYMPISKYPFVGADFRNLPPMCSECNSDFKKNTDILLDDLGNRRHCVDPYNGPVFKISLAESLPNSGLIQKAIRLPKWDIKFVGEPQEQAENWDRVFSIRKRYERDILNAEFRSWLEHFARWYRANHDRQLEGEDIALSIPEYIETVIQDGLADRAFLKAEVFRLLFAECHDPLRGVDMKAFLALLVENA